MDRRPTLTTVATLAGVSRQTVSNVINTPELVLPDTRERVLAAIESSGYRMNKAARQLRTRRSHQIGLGVRPAGEGASRQVLDQFLHTLVEQAQALDYRVLLFAVDNDETEIAACLDLQDTADVDGFVLTDTHAADARVARLSERGIPFVTFGRPWGASDARHSWVDVDGRAGLVEATAHLADLGYRRIAFIGWRGSESGADRRDGWWAVLQDRGLAVDPLERLVDGDSTAGAALAARELFAAGAEAIVCASDALAIGALTVARELVARGELAAPVGIVGFDDSPVGRALGLTSVAQPIDDVVHLVLTSLLDGLADAGRAPLARLVAPRLQARATSRFRLDDHTP